MKLIYIYVIFLSNQIFSANQMAVQSRTNAIYHRYYLIKRLEQSCVLLQQPNVQQIIPFNMLDETIFKSDQIRSAVKAMKTAKNAHALIELWADFSDYKDTYDELFKYEFIELIYMVYDLMHSARFYKSGLSLEHTLCMIDAAVEAKATGKHILLRAQPQELALVTTDLVAKRFYIIKRLQKSMQFLSHLHENDFGFMQDRRSTAHLMAEIENFQHDRIRESLIQMCQTKNLEPLLHLCEEVKQYRFAQDESFLQEMLMNIFLVYKTILLRSGPHHADPVIVHEMNHVLEIYEHLDSMPLDETLEAIDMVTDKLMAIQAEEFAGPNYIRWSLAGGACVAVGLAAYYYFVHRG